MEDDFFTIKEFAAKLGVHQNTVRRSIKKGRLNAFRIGHGERSHYRIPKTEINRIAFLDLEKIIGKIVDEKKLRDR